MHFKCEKTYWGTNYILGINNNPVLHEKSVVILKSLWADPSVKTQSLTHRTDEPVDLG